MLSSPSVSESVRGRQLTADGLSLDLLLNEESTAAKLEESHQQTNLGEWPSTAISGNDILSSVLFTAGLTASKAGKLAPIAQCIVVVVVYCFRWVFEEVVSAVPLNGGCYNAILNSSTKKVAAVAATFSILSYLATGVVCGVSAFNYVNYLMELPVVVCTVAMLFVFAMLCLIGIAESAIVALVFFVFHALTLTVLCVCCIVYAVQHPSTFTDNMHTSIPDVTIFGSLVNGNVLTAVFLGYAPALLSVTGFESSAQFVEEQATGVFPKTLRNMWALSSVFNVAFSILSLAVVPLNDIVANKEVLLAYMGKVSSGHWLELLVTIDAFVVLSGAVLTSYVGINGLVQRLAIDRILPKLLLAKNSCRSTNHFIIMSYFLIASSLVVILNGQIDALSGVFAFAFLGVMTSFAFACISLKVHREDIPRESTTSWLNAVFCFVMITLGLLSNAMGDATALKYFAIYFVAFGVVILVMLERVRILQALLYISRKMLIHYRYGRHGQAPAASAAATRGHGFIGSVMIAKTIEKIKKTPVIFFCKAANLPKINEAISYVIQNEQTYCLRLVHICTKNNFIPQEFEDIVCLFDHIYPSIKIDFVSITGTFDPAMVEWISTSMDIPTNMMFMRQPANKTIHKVSALGVRVITN
uniref:Amino acid permease/ SLC12A domain-containing protein n=1 Tax=Globisporangium ultimum (strain ATCC 200006 / CBS 805.95 / DAOM BR144) TaxID=431595 RepID=K3XAH4_GLOUD